jgi:hypothetical protein
MSADWSGLSPPHISRCGGNGAEEHEPGVAWRSTSSVQTGADERELQPGGGGGGRGVERRRREESVRTRGDNRYTGGVGAPNTPTGIGAGGGDLGAP